MDMLCNHSSRTLYLPAHLLNSLNSTRLSTHRWPTFSTKGAPAAQIPQ
jgi:hypothetical protein